HVHLYARTVDCQRRSAMDHDAGLGRQVRTQHLPAAQSLVTGPVAEHPEDAEDEQRPRQRELERRGAPGSKGLPSGTVAGTMSPLEVQGAPAELRRIAQGAGTQGKERRHDDRLVPKEWVALTADEGDDEEHGSAG